MNGTLFASPEELIPLMLNELARYITPRCNHTHAEVINGLELIRKNGYRSDKLERSVNRSIRAILRVMEYRLFVGKSVENQYMPHPFDKFCYQVVLLKKPIAETTRTRLNISTRTYIKGGSPDNTFVVSGSGVKAQPIQVKYV